MTTTDSGIDVEGADEVTPDEIDASFVPKQRATVAHVDVDGELVLLDGVTKATHLLNSTALVVWSCFDGSGDISELAYDLAEAYHVEVALVENDIIELARELGAKGLLEGVAAPVHKHDHGQPEPTGLPVGTVFPSFNLPLLGGGELSLEDLLGQRVLLINWSPRCGFCDRIAPDLVALAEPLAAADVATVLVAGGSQSDNREKCDALGLDVAVVLHDNDVEPFVGQGTPAAYLLDERGAVARPFALGALRVPELARVAAALGPLLSRAR